MMKLITRFLPRKAASEHKQRVRLCSEETAWMEACSSESSPAEKSSLADLVLNGRVGKRRDSYRLTEHVCQRHYTGADLCRAKQSSLWTEHGPSPKLYNAGTRCAIDDNGNPRSRCPFAGEE
ncbi:unnamed protein product [Microthlaspi erraticum]|uniref:Uncharacterized protein n=1 Tax=Microthlaspi erraticum TaxID=1685480 RepID=A0A6D2IBR5_9BRAS|nr:unnamed protein product [Microthlaspi erraticum]